MHRKLIFPGFFLSDFDFNALAFGRLIRREFVSDELPSMIGDIFKSKDVDNTIRRLPKDDAQGFVDAVYQARHSSAHYRESAQGIDAVR